MVPENEARQLEDHLLSCASCLNRLKGFQVEDPIVGLIQESVGTVNDMADESLVETLISRLKSLHLPISENTSSERATPVAPSHGNYGASQFLALPQSSEELGRLGQYRILSVLGTGGMGVVFEAEDVQLERRVALKVMKPESTANGSARERFVREAKAAAAVVHDHLVPVFQVGEDRGIPFLAMPLLQGQTLEERLKKDKPIPLGEICRIAREAAEGLAAAHERGLIHRDIKPANIWLESKFASSTQAGHEGRVKILDFGLAHVSGKDTHLTETGTILGSPGYMAPEQIDGQSVDARADLFSLGCVIYRMATGVLPFQGPDLVSVLWAVSTKEPRPPKELNQALPSSLAELTLRLLEKRAADRPDRALAVAERVRGIEAELQQATSFTPSTTFLPGQSQKFRWGLRAAIVLLCLLPVGYLFGTPLLRFVTNKGELVVEFDDPKAQVEVKVLQDSLVVRDRTTDRSFVLTPGDGEVQVFEKASGLQLATRRFSLTRGGREVVAVHLERSTDRAAAEWVLRSGGKIQISQKGAAKSIASVDDLPQSEFQLTAIDLTNNAGVTGSALGVLEKLSNLNELDLHGTGIDDSGLAYLRGLAKLEKLNLANTIIRGTGLAHLMELPSLKRLFVEGTQLDDIGLASLQGNRKLEVMSIGETKITDEGLRVLATLPELRCVYVGRTTVGDAGLGHLMSCRYLNVIGLAGTKITDSGLMHIKEKGKDLDQLNLSETQITDACLPVLRDLRKLRELYLGGTKVTPAGVASLQKDLPDCRIHAAGLAR